MRMMNIFSQVSLNCFEILLIMSVTVCIPEFMLSYSTKESVERPSFALNFSCLPNMHSRRKNGLVSNKN